MYSDATLAAAAIHHLPLPVLGRAADWLDPNAFVNFMPDTWETISDSAACEENAEDIVRNGHHEYADRLDNCRALCAERNDCFAIDFFRDTTWCNFFSRPCTAPLRKWHGAQSERLIRGHGTRGVLVFYAGASVGDSQFSIVRELNARVGRYGIETRLVRCPHSDLDCPSDFGAGDLRLVLSKRGGLEEYVGHIATEAVLSWARASVESTLTSLSPAQLATALQSGKQWFIVYLTPSEPLAVSMLGRFRQAADTLSNAHGIRSGFIDCERSQQYIENCEGNMVANDAGQFPAPVFYNSSGGSFPVDGEFYTEASQTFVEHVEDVLHPPLLKIVPDEWESVVIGAEPVFVVMFSAGSWCGPCVEAKRQLKQVAKELREVAVFGVVDCDKFTDYCGGHHVRAYPDIRLWPNGRKSVTDGGVQIGSRITCKSGKGSRIEPGGQRCWRDRCNE